MIQNQIQTAEYWESGFTLSDTDLEQIYNVFLETGQPKSVERLAEIIIASRIKEQVAAMRKAMADTVVYQPQNSYKIDDELVFPALKMARGSVKAIRPGYNPEVGNFSVISVEIKGKPREFAAGLQAEHALNDSNGDALADELANSADDVMARYGSAISQTISKTLEAHDDFVQLDEYWFVRSLMADINIGHLHLAEAILELAGGGPLTSTEILPQLELDPSVDQRVQAFTLTNAMAEDGRFDEVLASGKQAWFLRRMEPETVRETPERLKYEPVQYDRALLNPQQKALEQELDDEWSDLPLQPRAEEVTIALTYPHRWAGTLPLNSRTRSLFRPDQAERQRVLLIDDETGQELPAWVVGDQRYVSGLSNWYRDNRIPVGGFLRLQPQPEPGVFKLGYDRRRAQREWVRLASIKDNRMHFELQRRAVPCGYDDLLIVGTDAVTAIDTHAKRMSPPRSTLADILSEVFPSLASLTPQNTVHAKTLYSAVNMVRRLPPGPIFAELVRHPSFKAVGDNYWQFESAG